MTERIKIAGKIYKVPAMDDLTLDDILMLDAELQDRYRSSWVKVQEFVMWSTDKEEAEVEAHPASTLMAGVTVWMVLRISGKQPDITMREALAVPPSEIEDVETAAPKDRLSKKGKTSRKASVRVVAPSASAPEESSPQTTSSEQSVTA